MIRFLQRKFETCWRGENLCNPGKRGKGQGYNYTLLGFYFPFDTHFLWLIFFFVFFFPPFFYSHWLTAKLGAQKSEKTMYKVKNYFILFLFFWEMYENKKTSKSNIISEDSDFFISHQIQISFSHAPFVPKGF